MPNWIETFRIGHHQLDIVNHLPQGVVFPNDALSIDSAKIHWFLHNFVIILKLHGSGVDRPAKWNRCRMGHNPVFNQSGKLKCRTGVKLAAEQRGYIPYTDFGWCSDFDIPCKTGFMHTDRFFNPKVAIEQRGADHATTLLICGGL
mmetsp:Transcript_2400/g.6903  ORF Transcript_2400/g.6903 Transcript_2400/m.6903 type:complete len:146 (+) Transcript_2400:1183-1620(+)